MPRNDPFSDPARLLRRVYAYVAYRVGDGHAAEDIASETFERALRYRDGFDPRRGDPASWLIGIARRCIADAALRRELPTDEMPEVAIEGHEERAVRRIELAAAVAQLDERDRELVALRFGGDLTAKQIGELLDMHTNAVEVALHRTLAKLRAILDSDEAGQGEPAELQWTPRTQD
ncbi:MAG: sigma-70 family RNA polymerase sigma factor [Acidobacteriota bacterium]|nr:sigma-70 family RNA polymerase sigma factor [Acidobacteriota bacterium]